MRSLEPPWSPGGASGRQVEPVFDEKGLVRRDTHERAVEAAQELVARATQRRDCSLKHPNSDGQGVQRSPVRQCI